MPEGDHKRGDPKTSDDRWFIDFDDESTLDLDALMATHREPKQQGHARPRSQPHITSASEPKLELGALSDPTSDDPSPPLTSEPWPEVGPASEARRGETAHAPARLVEETSAEPAPQPVDVAAHRGVHEDDQARALKPRPAVARPDHGPVSQIPEGGAAQRSEGAATRRARRRIVGAALLAACLAGGVLFPIGRQWVPSYQAERTKIAPISAAIPETALRSRSATQTAWRDPPTAAVPVIYLTEVIALEPENTIVPSRAIRISAVLAPPDVRDGLIPSDTSTALQLDDEMPTASPSEENTVEPSTTVVARTGPVVLDEAHGDLATAHSPPSPEGHTKVPERGVRVVNDGARSASSTVSAARETSRDAPVNRHLARKAKPAAYVPRSAREQSAPERLRTNRLARRSRPTTPGLVALRQTTISPKGWRDRSRPSSPAIPTIAGAEPPRALVLPASLQPTPF